MYLQNLLVLLVVKIFLNTEVLGVRMWTPVLSARAQFSNCQTTDS